MKLRSKIMSEVKIGCCGFPEGRKEYSEQLKLVEIQRTFYRLPQEATAKKWREEVPQEFEFTLKAWQQITHPPSSPTYRKAGLRIPPEKEGNFGFFRPTPEVFQAWEKTSTIAQILRAKVIVFQCPAKFSATEENVKNMRYFFTHIGRGDFIFAWEPRGEWDREAIVRLCRDLDLVHCVDPLESEAYYGKPSYFRLHGGPGYRHQYTDEELARLRELVRGGAYVLFNNLTMYQDALRFKELIERGR